MMSKLVLLLAALAAAAFGETKVMTWEIDGVKREAIVYSPAPKKAAAKAPVVLAFHGHGDTAENYQGAELEKSWPQAIVVYPRGLPSSRDGASGWQVERGKDGDRDLKFVDQMLATLHKQFMVDDARIYSTGFSNGANFTYLLWAERPNVFAAFAPVAARILPSVQLTVPKPVFHIGGTADRQIVFADQKQAIEAARRANNATGKGETCGLHCTRYQSAGGAPVMTLIHNEGHVYPDEVSPMIMDFFRKHPLTEQGATGSSKMN
jgi:polyhydroxybutyrate depolymerase